jgi:hypothetical protein
MLETVGKPYTNIVVTYYNTFLFKYADNLDYFLIEREIMYLFNIDYIK